MISAATEFKKSGYSENDALTLALIASKFQNIADAEISSADAAKFINSQMKAFNITADEAESIIDKVNETANNFAFGTDDLQKALTLSSSTLKGYGNDINQVIAILGANMEVMPNKASQIARGWNTIAANIYKASQESESWVAANGKVNISFSDSNGNLKSTYDILKDLYNGIEGQSVAWKDLGESEKSAIALAIGGATQQSKFKATMDNFGAAVGDASHELSIYEAALNSAGSADKENQKAQESLEFALRNLNDAWEQLSTSFVQSDFLIGVVHLATDLLDLLNALTEKIGVLGTLITTIGVSSGLTVGIKTLYKLLSSKIASNAIGALLFGASGGTGLLSGSKGILNLLDKINLAETASISLYKKKGKEYREIKKAREALGVSTKVEAAEELKSLKTTYAKLLKFQPLITAISGAFGGLALSIGAIAAIKWGTEKLDEIFGLEAKEEEVEEYAEKLADVNDQISKLEAKAETEGLTEAEQRELDILIAERNELEKQLEIKKQLAAKTAQDEFMRSGGLAEDASDSGQKMFTQATTVKDSYTDYLEAQAQVDYWVEKLSKAQQEVGKHSQQELDYLQQQVDAYRLMEGQAKEAYETASDEQKKYAEKAIADWEEAKAVNSEYYSSWDEQAKAQYDKLQENALYAKALLGELTENQADWGAKLINAFGSDTFGELNIDLTQIEDLNELIQQVADGINNLPDDKEIQIYARDESGNIIDQLELKKGDLTNEEWQVLIGAYESGDESAWEELDNFEVAPEHQIKFKEVALILQKDQEKTWNSDDLDLTQDVKYNPIKTEIETLNTSIEGTPIVQSVVYTPDYSQLPSNGTVKIKNGFLSTVGHATGKRKGEQGGTAWLGDEGTAQNPRPELVQTKDGAYLAGQSGWELVNLDSSDIVYTADQTKKLLGDDVSGDTGYAPRYASGNNNEAFADELENLEYRRDVEHWTDARFQSEYRSLYNRYAGQLSTSQEHAYGKAAEEYATEVAEKEIENLQDIFKETGEGFDQLIKKINANAHYSSEERQDALQEAYKAAVEYNLAEYKNGKDTREDILADIKNYYNVRGTYDAEYYSMLNDLREADKDAEVERLDELNSARQDSLTLAEKYLQQQLDVVNAQIEAANAAKEEADAAKELADLQADLASAQQNMVRVLKDGQWVYEADAEAIKEAQDALDDYASEHATDELQAQADEIQAIIDLFGEMKELSDIKELELKLNVSNIDELTGGLGLDEALWTAWIKQLLAEAMAYEDIATLLGDTTGTDIDAWLGDVWSSDRTVGGQTIAEYIAKHSFASGTTNAPGGLSLVGEKGAELVGLTKGSTVFTSAMSRNLLQWAKYTPESYEAAGNMNGTQTFNFENLSLPNVHNAKEFINELQKLPNMAIVRSAKRV